MIRSLTTGLVGMSQGEHKLFVLLPNEAYGLVKSKLIREIPRTRFPKQLRIGQRLIATHGLAGARRHVRIKEIKPRSVVVDGNHPLAGQTVQFDVMLISIDSSPDANKTRQQYDIAGKR